jgi:hypothetical protein
MAQRHEKKRRHLLKYNSDGETKDEAENGGYLCPSPLSVGISLNMRKKMRLKTRFNYITFASFFLREVTD